MEGKTKYDHHTSKSPIQHTISYDERFSPAICTNSLGSGPAENARHTAGYSSAFRKDQSLKDLAHLIRQNRSS